MSDDPEAGLAFCAALFGWQKTTAIDMGAMGTYPLFGREGEYLGGMMRRPEGVPSSAWSFYFSVPSVQAATPRVAEARRPGDARPDAAARRAVDHPDHRPSGRLRLTGQLGALMPAHESRTSASFLKKRSKKLLEKVFGPFKKRYLLFPVVAR
jgi:hypothetical protein